MTITLVGMGMGTPATLTAEALKALQEADCLMGAPRLLASLPERFGGERIPCTRPADMLARIGEQRGARRLCVLLSGDAGFYSAAAGLAGHLSGHAVTTLPGLSSLQVLAARLSRPWQAMHAVSAHAESRDPVPDVMNHAETFFLTGSAGPAALCAALHRADMAHVSVTVGENLGLPGERIRAGSPAALMREVFAPLSVMLVDNPSPLPSAVAPFGLPDSAFIRGDVPMTKRAVRALALAKLAPRAEETLWDIGAGTGSVAVEMALAARYGHVFAVERRAEAQALIAENRLKFGVYNLACVCGSAPAALAKLPAPDAVFIGGSGGGLPDILSAVVSANPHVRVVATAIALETVGLLMSALTRPPFRDFEAVTLTVAESQPAGALHLMRGHNPVTIMSARACEEVSP